MCAYNVSNNPKGSTEHLLDIPRVPIYCNLPASPSILQGIGDPLLYLYVFRWTLVCIPPGRFLNLGGWLFLNRGEPSIALKAILIPRYICGNISPGGVFYIPNYQFWPLF